MPPAKTLTLSGVIFLLIIASCLLLSCSSSDPATPLHDDIGNTYVRATITVLDTGAPCTAFSCDPELYECRSRNPIVAGQQWTVHSTVASAGMVSDTQFVITGTDTTRLTSVALEMAMTDFTVSAPSARFTLTGTANSPATWADIDTQCDQVRSAGPESRFHLVRGDTNSSVTLTDANVTGTALVPAVSDGQGGFSPASIIEGNFSFVGQVFQAAPTGSLTGEVLVEGCFRVNLPRPERGVPVTPAPSAPICN